MKASPYLLLLITILAFSCSQKPAAVQSGLDVAATSHFDFLHGKHIGVITNHTAIDRSGKHLVDVLYKESGVYLDVIFATEHGFRGESAAGDDVNDSIDAQIGIKVVSIYGSVRKPTPKMLKDLDALVFDIQDVGARFYTYISTMGLTMEAAAENGLEYYVLDRPNPISGRTDGPILQMEYQSFVGMFPITIQHGMTIGELAQMIKGESWMKTDLSTLKLTVIPMKNWNRKMFWNETGLNWIAPSPNIPDFETAAVYPGVCLLEGVAYNEGRGTMHPFLWSGAPYVNSADLIGAVKKAYPSDSYELMPVGYIPVDIPGKSTNMIYKDDTVHGFEIHVKDPENFYPVQFGVYFLSTIKGLYPKDFQWRNDRWIKQLWGNDQLNQAIDAGESAESIIESYQDELKQFNTRKEGYLIYP